ncbi:MAG: hypothetical protein J6I73_08615 [Treponema sp.]|nr:hypothetical protein [Treponema sp.]
MLNTSLQKNAKIQGMTGKTFAVLLLSYIVPYLFYMTATFLSGMLTFKQFLSTLSIFHIVVIVLIEMILGACCWIFNSHITKYDYTEESAHQINRKVILFERLMVIVGFSILILAAFATAEFHMITNRPHFIEAAAPRILFDIFCMIGVTCVSACGPYIFFLNDLERKLTWLPFSNKDVGFSFLARSIIITEMGLIGIVILTVQLFFVPNNLAMSKTALIFQRIIPTMSVVIAFCAFGIYVNAKTILTNIGSITKFSDSIANKNYGIMEMPVDSRTEIGMLILNLNKWFASGKGLLKRVKEASNLSVEMTEQLVQRMNNASSNVTQITDGITSVQNEMTNQSAGVDETNASINQIMGSIRELGESIDSQAASVSESSAAIDEMVANIRSMTQILEKNMVSVKELSNASDEGRNSVQSAVETSQGIIEQSASLMEASTIIQTIASQTNLLAMNAAIESAHAGEAGKGFAVVADEIRKLAEQSSQQGKAINDNLKALSASIADVAEDTKEVQQKFDVIYDLSQVVRNQENVIMNAMSEQASGNQQVLEAMKNINDTTSAVRDRSHEMVSGGEQIVKEMAILSDVTGKISERMNAMTDNISQIDEGMQEVNESSAQTMSDMSKLASIVNSFTLD